MYFWVENKPIVVGNYTKHSDSYRFSANQTHYKLVFDNADYYWDIYFSISVLPLVVAGTLITSVVNGYQKYKCFIPFSFISTLISCLLMIMLIQSYGTLGHFLPQRYKLD